MTSKEKLINLISALEITGGTAIKKDVVKQYKEDILEDLEVLEILKEFLSSANTGTGWIEINIDPEHDILDSEEHKKKQLLIKEWLDEG